MPKKRPEKLILDAWAVLALLQGEEPAAPRLAEALSAALTKSVEVHMAWVNLGEVYYIVGRRAGQAAAAKTLDDLLQLPIRAHEPDRQAVVHAATVKMEHRVSYADAFAVALAKALAGTLLTGDPEILGLPGSLVTVERLERHRAPSQR